MGLSGFEVKAYRPKCGSYRILVFNLTEWWPKAVNPEASKVFRRIQWALGAAQSSPLELNGFFDLALTTSSPDVFASSLVALLRQHGSVGAEITLGTPSLSVLAVR